MVSDGICQCFTHVARDGVLVIEPVHYRCCMLFIERSVLELHSERSNTLLFDNTQSKLRNKRNTVARHRATD